uniref:Trehalose-phosphatase n=2 Tax=Chrysotila carterae TaxID=13221 RepID=A0A6S9Y9Y1_CHRCT
MEAYTARTNASQIHNKGSAISWLFDDVDPEFGMMQAKELQDHLQGVLANYPVVVIMGKGYIEVRPKGINKGAMVEHVINMLYQQSGGVDFVLCIGDDAADEYMFSSLNARFSSQSKTPSAASPAVFTAVVGRKPSAAAAYLNDPDEVLELCQSLRLHSTRANRNRSTSDLQRLSNKRVTLPSQRAGAPMPPLWQTQQLDDRAAVAREPMLAGTP